MGNILKSRQLKNTNRTAEMAWNEPGDQKDRKEDWKSRGNQQDGPPDLEAVFGKLKDSVMGLFGKKPSGNRRPPNSGAGNTRQSSGNSFGWLITLAVVGLIVWVISGIFIVEPAERGVVMRFGKYTETLLPGPHWIPTFISTKAIVNVSEVDNYSYHAQMLTKDENIVSVSIAVQYKISDPEAYLFNINNPKESLRQATASALRQVIGDTTLNDVLTTGREKVRQEVSTQITNILNKYQAGIMLTDVAMQPAKAPEEVKDSFDDAIKAQEDEQRYINQAQAYSMAVLPRAQGQAKRLQEEAKAYKEQVVLAAQGDVARFLALVPEYQQQPELTRQRLYLDMMQQVLSRTAKIMVDTQGSNNLLYLPLDKWIKNAPLADKALNQQQKEAILNDWSQNRSDDDSTSSTSRRSYRDVSRQSYTYGG